MDDKDLIFEMLEDFAKLSGEDLGDILAEGLEEELQREESVEIETFGLDEAGSEDTVEDEFSMENEFAESTDDYLDGLFDDVDVSDSEVDYYGDE